MAGLKWKATIQIGSELKDAQRIVQINRMSRKLGNAGMIRFLTDKAGPAVSIGEMEEWLKRNPQKRRK